MFRATLAAWLALLIGWGASAPQMACGENYAFLVAVGDYDVDQLKPLAYSRRDIQVFAQTLEASGFKPENIVLMHDDLKVLKQRRFFPEADKIRKEFELLLSSVDEGDSLIVAFSGHGVQFEKDERNFFCPADTELEDPDHAKLISLKEIYDKLEQCPADRKLLLVDACRNDPQSKLAKSRQTVKLNSVTRPQVEPVPKGIVALFSCSAGQESFEWPELQHGIFFHHILTGWNGEADTGDSELSLDELVAYTRKSTQTFARLKLGRVQTPQLKGEFNGTWVLRKESNAARGYTNSIGMKFNRIAADEFQMGSSDTDVAALVRANLKFKAADAKDEQPQHRVKLERPFYMSVHEVTQAQYQSVVGTNPSHFSSSGNGREHISGQDHFRFPVESVSWFDAVEFCNSLSSKEGRTPRYKLSGVERTSSGIAKAKVDVVPGDGYRLPTEAEWEYACRAGTKSIYHFGDVLNGNEANAAGTAPFGTTTKGPSLQRPTRVGAYGENAFGLFDMHGNVSEWCEDTYDEKAYLLRGEVASNPLVTTGSQARVLRGGSWVANPADCRTTSRGWNSAALRVYFAGFRVVSPTAKPQP